MRQLTYTEGGKVEWREAVDAALEGDGEALVRPVAVATCDLDLLVVRGQLPIGEPLPAGHEGVGEVVDAGDAVGSFAPGDLVSDVGQVCDPGTPSAFWFTPLLSIAAASGPYPTNTCDPATAGVAPARECEARQDAVGVGPAAQDADQQRRRVGQSGRADREMMKLDAAHPLPCLTLRRSFSLLWRERAGVRVAPITSRRLTQPSAPRRGRG